MNLKGFLDYLRARNYSTGTINSYRIELEKFQLYLREHRLHVNQVRPRHIQGYLLSRDPHFEIRAASTRRRIAVLKTFYSFIVVMANGRVRNPVEAIRYPRRQPPNPHPLTEEQLEILINGIGNPRDQAIIALLLHSGLRVAELCSLDRDSIRVEILSPAPGGKVVGVGRILGKGSKEREFLVDLPTLRAIHSYLSQRGQDGKVPLFLSNRGRRISKRAIQHMLRAHCDRLGLPAFHPHQLRSTFASRLHRLGVPMPEISMLLGHASLDTTQIYVQPDARRVRTEYFAAMEMLSTS